MRREERERYRGEIARDIEARQVHASPEDPWWPLIRRMPEWFDALAALARDPVLGASQRLIAHRVPKYLISPLDLRPQARAHPAIDNARRSAVHRRMAQ